MKTSIKSFISILALSTLLAFNASADDKDSKKVTAFGTGIYLTKAGKIQVNVDKFNNKPTIIQIESQQGEILFQEISGKKTRKIRNSMDVSTLPLGRYTISVTSDGQRQSRTIELNEKPVERLISFK